MGQTFFVEVSEKSRARIDISVKDITMPGVK
jgi:hypothetical protein